MNLGLHTGIEIGSDSGLYRAWAVGYDEAFACDQAYDQVWI